MIDVKLFDIQEREWASGPEGMRSCVFKPNDNYTMQYWEIQPGAGAEPHSHPHEQLIYIQQGSLDVIIEGTTYELKAGCFCLVPSGAEHATVNNGSQCCINIDVFVPQREDRTESKKIRSYNHKNWE